MKLSVSHWGIYIIMLFYACNKETQDSRLDDKNIKSSTEKNNTNQVQVDAGDDQNITLPMNEVTLNGSVISSGKAIKTIRWAKLSGPASFQFENDSLLTPRVSKLEEGKYEFELIIVDTLGLMKKDLVVVNVWEFSLKAYSTDTLHYTYDVISLIAGLKNSTNYGIKKILWSKISGPNSYIIHSNDKLETYVSGLSMGDYHFQVEVTNTAGVSIRDTIAISVKESGFDEYKNKLYFTNLSWIYPWYVGVEVKNFLGKVPPDKTFKVFIRVDNGMWVEAYEMLSAYSDNRYEYWVETRFDGAGMYSYKSLYIWDLMSTGQILKGTVDVAICFN